MYNIHPDSTHNSKLQSAIKWSTTREDWCSGAVTKCDIVVNYQGGLVFRSRYKVRYSGQLPGRIGVQEPLQSAI